MRTPRPVILEGEIVRLEPLDPDRHGPELEEAATPAVFAVTGTNPYAEGWDAYFARAADPPDPQVVFAQVERASGRAVGMTRFVEIVESAGKLEIGNTWLAERVWRTGFNRESKFLLLQHCFEELRTVRVVLVTDIRNERSQQAILGLGATKEGVLRKERQRSDGSWRDTVQFSITDDDWPAVRARLETSAHRLRTT